MTAIALRLRELVRSETRVREVVCAVGLLALAWFAGQRVPYQYPLIFAGLAAVVSAFLMLRNQMTSLMLILFASTVHYFIKVVFFKWHPSAVVFKEGLLLLLFGFWAFELMTKQEGIRKTSLTMPLVAFAGWTTLECFNPNTYGVFTIIDDYRFWIGPLLIYLLTTHLVKKRADMERALKFIFGYMAVLTIYACFQPLMPVDTLVKLGADPNNYFFFYQGSVRAFSTMGAAPFAQMAAMMAPLAFFYMSQARVPLRRWAYALMGMVFVLGVVLTLVRTGWVSMAVSLSFYAIAARRRWILVVLLSAGIILTIFATGYMRAKWEGLLNPEEDASVQIRLQVARNIGDAVVFRAFGYGLGTFAQNRLGVISDEKTGYGRATDNFYLTLVLEMGWVGLGLFLWMLYKIYRMGLGHWRGLKTTRYRELAIAIVAALVNLDVAKFGGPAGYYPPEAWHYWFLVGLLVLLPSFDEELAEEQAASPAQNGVA